MGFDKLDFQATIQQFFWWIYQQQMEESMEKP